MIFIILPIFSFISILLLIKQFNKKDSSFSWADSFLLTAIIGGSGLVVLTEVLSFSHLLSFQFVASSWSVISVCLGWLLWKFRKEIFKLNLTIPKLSLTERILCVSIGLIALVIAYIAWNFPPNTWDSMTYHLSRVSHWVQNQTLDHYPTNILRQLSYCPFAEYVILHSVILINSDLLANFTQYFAMIGSWMGVYVIAALLGADRLGGLIAVFLTATLPMGILQGSSTQTDYVATLWLICFVYCVLRWDQNSTWRNTIFTGLALGLAMMTKAYTCLYAAPFLLLMISKIWRPWKFIKVVMLLVVLLIALLLSTGQCIRNLSTFGTVYGHSQGEESHQYTFGAITGNLLRNFGSNLGTSWPSVNNTINKPLTYLINTVDRSKQNFVFKVPDITHDEDAAGSIQHLVIGILSVFFWILFYRHDKKIGVYAICLAGMAVFFAFGVSWQLWVSRFHLPFFAVAMPWVGVVWQRMNIRGSAILIVFIFLILAEPFLLSGMPRKLIGKGNWMKVDRIGRYFVKKPHLAPAYSNAVGGVIHFQCSNVGLILGPDSWEYPLWVLLQKENSKIRLEHVGVDNLSNKLKYPLGEFDPCMIISDDVTNEYWQGEQGKYQRIWTDNQNVSVFIKHI